MEHDRQIPVDIDDLILNLIAGNHVVRQRGKPLRPRDDSPNRLNELKGIVVGETVSGHRDVPILDRVLPASPSVKQFLIGIHSRPPMTAARRPATRRARL